MPSATSSAAYWICKARVAAKAAQDDFMSALTVLDEAEAHNPQVSLLTALLLSMVINACNKDDMILVMV